MSCAREKKDETGFDVLHGVLHMRHGLHTGGFFLGRASTTTTAIVFLASLSWLEGHLSFGFEHGLFLCLFPSRSRATSVAASRSDTYLVFC